MSPAARILVVDDAPHARDLLKRLLGMLGEVSQASDPKMAATRLSEEGPFDLVFTDMMMPNAGDGLIVLNEVRAHLPDTPLPPATPLRHIHGALDSIQQGA